MLGIMVAVFLVGYLCIAMEHKLQVNKAASALLTGGILWALYIVTAPLSVPQLDGQAFGEFLSDNPTIAALPLVEQCVRFISGVQIVEHLGEISETLFFLIGAMTIVELIDVHGGFSIITNRITTRKKVTLLWLISILTFFMSAVLDNMTTAIVMVMLIRRIIPEQKERWLFASIIIIAANSGGAWSPIGDVTTIMLWVKGNVTSVPLVESLLLPSLVSTIVPVWIASRSMHGMITSDGTEDKAMSNVEQVLTPRERLTMLILGVSCLLFVPVFKSLTHLPPFMGIMVGLGIMWVYTELLYRKKVDVAERDKHRVTQVIRHIDIPTILFFLGILLAVAALQATGILDAAAGFLNRELHNIYIINVIIGLMSSIVDNVPLVAGAMGMYPIVDPAMVGTMADPAFMQHFVQDGPFWLFLAYCAGVGGSLLIIGSAAGVVVMGLAKINFTWYLKRITLMALAGYLAGAAVFVFIEWLKLGAAF